MKIIGPFVYRLERKRERKEEGKDNDEKQS